MKTKLANTVLNCAHYYSSNEFSELLKFGSRLSYFGTLFVDETLVLGYLARWVLHNTWALVHTENDAGIALHMAHTQDDPNDNLGGYHTTLGDGHR